jgi:hypothetical protein
MNKKSQKVDDTLVVGVMCSIILAMLIWTAIMLHDVKKDVKHIGVQLDSIHVTLTEMLKPVDTDISAKANE